MKLYLRIFLSFWIATVMMIVVVATAADVMPLSLRVDRGPAFDPNAAEADFANLLNQSESQGHAAIGEALQSFSTKHRRHIFLFDGAGKVVTGDGTPPVLYSYLAKEALEQGNPRLERYMGFRTLFICPLRGPSGRQYAVIMTVFEPGVRLLRTRFWINIALAMLPAAIVCILLSLYITRPITRLRATAQRLASGDLSARSSPRRSARRDELGDLARDFDTMAAQIERLMTAQRRFVADVSHELGAPLTRLHLALALLRRQVDEKGSPELVRIERETDKLSNLVQQLLLLAGPEAGRYPAESLTLVSLCSLCEGIIEDANFEAAHANCVLAGTQEDVVLLGYPQLLRRAVDNILRNAIRYAPAGSTIYLNCRVDDDRRRVIIEVLDSGPGVPESMLSDIFLPFFRTSPGRESETGGTGLGLAIASEAVRLHDGTITAKNREGGGLEVRIAVPCRTPSPREGTLDLQRPSAVQRLSRASRD
jgi:two-component system sensor histidine kinase CpxA